MIEKVLTVSLICDWCGAVMGSYKDYTTRQAESEAQYRGAFIVGEKHYCNDYCKSMDESECWQGIKPNPETGKGEG